VTFAPTVDGDRSDALTITSNDPDSPYVVPITAQAVLPPDIETSPATIEAAAMPGFSKTKTLTVCNTGDSDLEFSVNSAETMTATVTQYPYLEVGKEEEDPRLGFLGSGGPDAFGYTWIDSDDTGGPVYDWIDIATIGTPIFNQYEDDDNYGPFPIGFDFPFYEDTFSEFRVCSNGFLSFTSDEHPYSNQPLPNAGAPENLLAVFWDDMVVDPSDGNEVYYYNDGTRLIVQYEVRRIAQYTPPYYSFQVILYPNGEIVYQYRQFGTITDSATIGIQNATQDDGLTVVFDAAYVHENLAIRFSSRPAWLTVEPASGVVAAGECMELSVLLDAAELEAGDYTGTIEIASNDPDEPLISTDVLLHVGLMEATWADVDPNTLNLDSGGKMITAYCEMPPEYDMTHMDMETVSFMLQVPCVPDRYSLSEDNNDNGIPDAMFKFDRAAVSEILPEGDDVEVCVYMEITDLMWFVARDTIRVIRPHMLRPNGDEAVLAGASYDIAWEDPDGWNVDYADLLFSPDGGETWEMIAGGVVGNSFAWTAPELETEEALVRVMVYDGKGAMGYDTSDNAFQVTATATDVPDGAVPTVFALRQNTPNPFNPMTVIHFDLPVAARTELRVYDLRGRLVKTLVSENLKAGYHEVVWDGTTDRGRKVAAGVYFYAIKAGDFAENRRMTLVK
jgi:hypothetical protein